MRTIMLIGLAALSATSADSGEMAMTGPDERTTPLPPARDGNVAIREELEAARRAATLAAYDLFIARHPRHPLEAVARRERDALARRPGARDQATSARTEGMRRPDR